MGYQNLAVIHLTRKAVTAFFVMTISIVGFAQTARDTVNDLRRDGAARLGSARAIAPEIPLILEDHGFVTRLGNGGTECEEMTAADAQAAAEAQRRTLDERRIITRSEWVRALRNHPELQRSEYGTTFKIILRSTAQLDSNATAKDAFIRAAAFWESKIQTPVTIVIDVDYGTTRFGQAYPNGVLGSTGTPSYRVAYTTIRSKLIASAKNASESTLYNTLPQSTVPTDLGSLTSVTVVSPLMRAFNLISADADPDTDNVAPSIGFNSNFDFDFDPSDGIAVGKTDFDAVAVHEMGHAIGFTSNVGMFELYPAATKSVTVWDLFRFRPGVGESSFVSRLRILSSGGDHVFFSALPTLACSTGRPDASGGDARQASHWKADEYTGNYLGIMDPTLASGTRKVATDNDYRMLEIIGWTLGAATSNVVTCSYTLSATSDTIVMGGATGSVSVTSSPSTCAWTATSNNAWITISSGASGTGNGTVNYTVASNSGAPRTGSITIGGRTYTISQAGCSYTLDSALAAHPSTISTGTVGVTTSLGTCTWTASTAANWITITSGASGTGNGTVGYSLTASLVSYDRSGTITIGDRNFVVTQAAGLSCGYALSSSGTTISRSGGVATVFLTASSSNCPWTATSNASWARITSASSGSGSTTVSYRVDSNGTGRNRFANLTIGGQTFVITQNR